MGQQAVAQQQQRPLDAIAQAVAHTPARLHRLLVIALKQAGAGLLGRNRQARAMQQPIEDGELGELLALKHRPQVKLHKRGAGEARRVAQQAQPLAVGHNAPELLGAVEILLHQRVGREARAARGRAGIEAGADTLNMQRRAGLIVPGAVRDRVGALIDAVGAAVTGQLVAQHAQQRQHPLLAGLAGARLTGGQVGEVGLKERPLATGGLPRRADAVGEIARPLKAKVLGALAGQLSGGERIENIGGDQPALGCDCCICHRRS